MNKFQVQALECFVIFFIVVNSKSPLPIQSHSYVSIIYLPKSKITNFVNFLQIWPDLYILPWMYDVRDISKHWADPKKPSGVIIPQWPNDLNTLIKKWKNISFSPAIYWKRIKRGQCWTSCCGRWPGSGWHGSASFFPCTCLPNRSSWWWWPGRDISISESGNLNQ